MTLSDWRGADPAVVREGYARERRHWQEQLGWDTSWTWMQVEQARAAGRLPGLVARDASGRPRGWAFFVLDHGTLHIGALVADDPGTTAALLDGALAAAADASAHAVACFILDRAPGIAAALAERGCTVEPFLYLARELCFPPEGRSDDARGWLPPAGGSEAIVLAESWADADRSAAGTLLRTAYTANAGIHFAPDGDWARYVSGVIDQAGCGAFDAGLSRVVRRGTQLEALALVTSLSPATAHLAQLAVNPALRGRGLGAALVRQTLEAAAAAGKSSLTLLVGEHNRSARRIYEGLGFAPRATFVATRYERVDAAAASQQRAEAR
jgi:ribosomal protein S18 acetylase RimI-like enzyme